ncbi:MAG: protein-tyrosine-phosphatase [Cyclobacteriaceae bacterium]
MLPITKTLFPALKNTVESLSPKTIPDERRAVLQPLINYIQHKKDKAEEIHLNFICTHNSRRSQFSQIWAQTAADLYSIEALCYSGGVEVTAFNERAVSSLQRLGFAIEKEGEGNPKYSVYYAKDAQPIIAFSKTIDDPAHTPKIFAAIMTCAHADENCPYIPEAEIRIPVRYNDPKAFDDTPQEAEKYDERSLQIATEMFFVFSNIK